MVEQPMHLRPTVQPEHLRPIHGDHANGTRQHEFRKVARVLSGEWRFLSSLLHCWRLAVVPGYVLWWYSRDPHLHFNTAALRYRWVFGASARRLGADVLWDHRGYVCRISSHWASVLRRDESVAGNAERKGSFLKTGSNAGPNWNLLVVRNWLRPWN